MANFTYGKARAEFLTGDIDYLADTIKVCLVLGTTTPPSEGVQDPTYADISAGVVGTPVALANKSVVSSSYAIARASNVTFTGLPSSGFAYYLIVYKDTGVASTSRLIVRIDSELITSPSPLPHELNGFDLVTQWINGDVFYL
jgi:hypothetical protein